MAKESLKSIVVLTGAGISAESGIKTFRDHNGLWESYRIEDVATPEGFARNPALVQRFYNERRKQLLSPEIKPNPAHEALSELERRWPSEVLVVTQNIDNLHERAGTKNLIHMHGELLKVRCTHTEKTFQWEKPVEEGSLCPCCSKAGTLRPHVVWFGEMPLEMQRIEDALSRCGIFVSIGTSGNVYPAAGFVGMVPRTAQKIELNAERSQVADAFDEHRAGVAGKIVPDFVKELLEK